MTKKQLSMFALIAIRYKEEISLTKEVPFNVLYDILQRREENNIIFGDELILRKIMTSIIKHEERFGYE